MFKNGDLAIYHPLGFDGSILQTIVAKLEAAAFCEMRWEWKYAYYVSRENGGVYPTWEWESDLEEPDFVPGDAVKLRNCEGEVTVKGVVEKIFVGEDGELACNFRCDPLVVGMDKLKKVTDDEEA